MKQFLSILLLITCVGSFDISGQQVDTLIVDNGSRRIFGLLHRPFSENVNQMPLAIIAHGFNGDHKYGENYFKPLGEAGYQCFTFDFPCGSINSVSDSNTVNMSIRDEQSDLKAIVEYFRHRGDVDKDHIVLIGESQGGLVSCLTASDLGDKIERLILCFPALCIPDNHNGRFKNEIPDTTYIWKVPLGKRYFEELRSIDAYEVMPRYTRPVLLIHGDKDEIVPLEYSIKATGVYRDAHLKIIKGAGHGFDRGDFMMSVEYIKDFLDR